MSLFSYSLSSEAIASTMTFYESFVRPTERSFDIRLPVIARSHTGERKRNHERAKPLTPQQGRLILKLSTQNLTTAAIAEKVGCSQPTVSRYLIANGRRQRAKRQAPQAR